MSLSLTTPASTLPIVVGEKRENPYAEDATTEGWYEKGMLSWLGIYLDYQNSDILDWANKQATAGVRLPVVVHSCDEDGEILKTDVFSTVASELVAALEQDQSWGDMNSSLPRTFAYDNDLNVTLFRRRSLNDFDWQVQYESTGEFEGTLRNYLDSFTKLNGLQQTEAIEKYARDLLEDWDQDGVLYDS